MQKIDPVVKRETIKIAVGTLALSAVMEAVFVILQKWDLTVLWGNLLGAFAAVLNFFLMSLTVVKCISMPADKAALKIRASQGGRLIMLAGFAILAALLPCFNLIAAVIPLLFPRIVIFVWQLLRKKEPAQSASDGAASAAVIEDSEDIEGTEN